MNTDGNTAAIERMLADREEHDERQDAEQEIADLRDEVDALAAKLAEWQAAQHYTYIGKDGKQVLARDLEARAEAAEARIAHLENHIEGVAKDTHKIMVDLSTPLDDPRVKALQDKAQAVVDRWDSPLWKDLRHTGTHINDLRDAISALEDRT